MLGLGLGANKLRGGTVLTELEQFFLDWGFINMWTSENVNINGTTTTFLDYAGEHDLANPGAGQQPVYNGSGTIGSEGKPSFNFNGSEYVMKNTANWRSADTTGEFVSVHKLSAGSSIFILTSADTLGLRDYYAWYVSGGLYVQVWQDALNPTDRRIYRGNQNVYGTPGDLVASNHCDGSAFRIYTNETLNSLAFTSGANDGASWMSLLPNRDNIAIGAKIGSIVSTSQFEWCMSGYRPFTGAGDTISVQQWLRSYYGF